jgi:hypothetical protein
MGDFEFDIEMLILVYLVEARAVLLDKTDDIYKYRIGTKRRREKFVFVLKKALQLSLLKKKPCW